MKRMGLGILLMLALTALWLPARKLSGWRPVLAQADLSQQTFLVEGVERTALIYKPSGKVASSGAPLVFVFHGHGGTARNSSRRFDIYTHWPEAMVVYMQGLPTEGKFDPEGRKPGWQKRAGELNDRDLKFFDEVLAWAKRTARIDSSRIYACGHSNGGMMTYVLWAARGNVIAAVAPSAAVFGQNAFAAKPKPALLIAGEGDVVIPTQMQQRSAEFVFKLNQCQVNGEGWKPGKTLYQSRVGADTALYVHKNGHRMPDNAGELMVQFFKQYSLK